MTETQSYNSYDPPKYKCGLCTVEVSKPFIKTHLTGHQHRIAYIVSQRLKVPPTFCSRQQFQILLLFQKKTNKA